MPFGIGFPELLLIFLAILLLFGAKRLPELAQGLGKGIRDFKKAMKDTGDEVKGPAPTPNNTQQPGAPPSMQPPKTDDHKQG
jgi:sec-independent protein translocase protein TatA